MYNALSLLSGRIATITQELLDQVRSSGRMDVVTDIAYPLPTIVIAEMLGVPTSDRPLFKQWADGLLTRQLSDAEFFKPEEEQRDNPEMRRFTRLFEEVSDYFKALLEDRRRQPRDDMMSELLAAEVDGEHLNMEDTISICILLLLAGHVTTTNLLGQAIRCFDEHPDAFEQVHKQPEHETISYLKMGFSNSPLLCRRRQRRELCCKKSCRRTMLIFSQKIHLFPNRCPM